MKLVIIESPYAARKDGKWDPEGVEENLRYLRAAMHDCLLKGEAPYASHALYTQPGVLDDQVPQERELGINAGFAWNQVAQASVFYVDRGLSSGMKQGIRNALESGRPIELRSLDNFCSPLTAETVVAVQREIGLVYTLLSRGE